MVPQHRRRSQALVHAKGREWSSVDRDGPRHPGTRTLCRPTSLPSFSDTRARSSPQPWTPYRAVPFIHAREREYLLPQIRNGAIAHSGNSRARPEVVTMDSNGENKVRVRSCARKHTRTQTGHPEENAIRPDCWAVRTVWKTSRESTYGDGHKNSLRKTTADRARIGNELAKVRIVGTYIQAGKPANDRAGNHETPNGEERTQESRP